LTFDDAGLITDHLAARRSHPIPPARRTRAAVINKSFTGQRGRPTGSGRAPPRYARLSVGQPVPRQPMRDADGDRRLRRQEAATMPRAKPPWRAASGHTQPRQPEGGNTRASRKAGCRPGLPKRRACRQTETCGACFPSASRSRRRRRSRRRFGRSPQLIGRRRRDRRRTSPNRGMKLHAGGSVRCRP
jgi:hypothetical protein